MRCGGGSGWEEEAVSSEGRFAGMVSGGAAWGVGMGGVRGTASGVAMGGVRDAASGACENGQNGGRVQSELRGHASD